MRDFSLPTDWSSSNIGECCQVLDSRRIPLNSQERAERKGNYPYYGANGVQGYIDDFIFDGLHVLLAEDGGYFDQWEVRPICYLADGKFWVNNHAHILRAKDFADTRFIHYSLTHKNILKHINGGTRSKLNQADMRDIDLALPPLPEQKKIAAILTSVDEVIEKTEAQIAKLQDLKTAMMQELLTKGIGHTEFKDSPVGRIPASWEAKTVRGLLSCGALVAVQDGNHGSQYPRREEFSDEGLPYLSASHISLHNEIDFSRCPKLPEKRAEELRIPPAKGGDVILTHNATIGRTAIIPEEYSRVIASTSTTYYRVNSEVLSNAFLYYFFQSASFQGQLQKVMGQTTRNQVPITEQRKLTILVPTLAEQERLAATIGALSKRIGITYQRLKIFRLQKKALMQDLLTGRVRVKV